MKIALSIVGATGRVGKRVLSLALEDEAFHIVGGFARKDSVCAGQDLGSLISKPPIGAFLHSRLAAACQLKKPLVIGSTGHSEKGKELIMQAAREIPILFSPNFSLGIALCLETVSLLAKNLYGSAFIDIIETHHIHKKDAPSGTAIALAKAAGNGKVVEGKSEQPRRKEEIIIHTIRSGEVIGEHVVIFECGSERIELKHQAS